MFRRPPVTVVAQGVVGTTVLRMALLMVATAETGSSPPQA